MTTTDGSDLLRFAVFCKKCSLYDENKCSRRVGQNAPKLGISRQFERRKNNDSSTFRMPRQGLRDGAKALSLLGSLDGNVEFTPYLHLWKIGLEKLK